MIFHTYTCRLSDSLLHSRLNTPLCNQSRMFQDKSFCTPENMSCCNRSHRKDNTALTVFSLGL